MFNFKSVLVDDKLFGFANKVSIEVKIAGAKIIKPKLL